MPKVDGGITAAIVPQAIEGEAHMIRTVTRSLVAIATLALLTVTTTTASTAGTPHRATIKIRPVATGLNGPSGFTFAPNGVIWYLERGTGEVRTLDPHTKANHLVFTIGGVNGDGERGALGIALSPRWPTKKVVFVYVTRSSGGHLWNQLIRFNVRGGTGHGLKVLLRSPASADPYHNGGRILFGPDHELYVMIGDGHNSVNAQDRSDNLRGKILRLDPDGTGAKGNPFGSRIWSYGHRNSFGFTFDPVTNRLWETENGPECSDEINRVVKGANYGWGPKESCSLPKPAGTNNSGPKPRHFPKRFFPSTIGITGDAFCHGCGIGALAGQLVFGDVNGGRLWAIHLNAARTGFSSAPRVIATAPTGVHSVEVSPAGRLFLSGPNGIYRLAA
jgi:glucose/arabinose dehydrogenase